MPTQELNPVDLKPFDGWVYLSDFRESVPFGNKIIETEALFFQHSEYGRICGASAGFDRSDLKSKYELIERACLARLIHDQFPKQFLTRDPFTAEDLSLVEFDDVFPPPKQSAVHATSNGVALHETWQLACRAAALELVERHAVLESWDGVGRPQRVAQSMSLFFNMAIEEDYEYETFFIGQYQTNLNDSEIFVYVCLLYPKDVAHRAQIIGMGAGYSNEDAQLKAEEEALQRYGFLYDMVLPSEIEPSPTQAYHQNFHLIPKNHWQIRSWLDGMFYVECSARERINMEFVDLTNSFCYGYHLVKAISKNVQELYYGVSTSNLSKQNYSDSDFVHPIP
ncbi:MAG: hypothetical protein EOP10_03005 [Proteobacteria bacterium]|nr:MAG: hypothetical protein EOP10_03005 [Pseudomonadota bacterium]